MEVAEQSTYPPPEVVAGDTLRDLEQSEECCQGLPHSLFTPGNEPLVYQILKGVCVCLCVCVCVCLYGLEDIKKPENMSRARY